MKSRDWGEVRINASISALQGLQESGKLGELLEIDPSVIAKNSVKIANALVEELQRNEIRKKLREYDHKYWDCVNDFLYNEVWAYSEGYPEKLMTEEIEKWKNESAVSGEF
jgi:hypothetical protein